MKVKSESILKSKLKCNFNLMFWVQALMEIRVINVISTLFLLHRGLTLSQIFYLTILFSIVSLLAEIPSSYLADKWGRKKVIIMAVLATIIYWIINIFAWSFPVFALTIVFHALSYALLSGTDIALIYDTSKQLKLEKSSLKNLGNYYSARRMFKIIVPIVAVLIAYNLTNAQYILVMSIDVIATFSALILSFFISEPQHYLKVEEAEAGVLKNAIKLFKENPNLLRIMFNKSLIFIAIFILYRINSEYFTSKGVTLLQLGIATAIYQFAIFTIHRKIEKLFPKISIESRINTLNIIVAILLILFLILSIINISGLLLLIIYALALTAEMARWPLFAEIINKASSSYNRATTLSLANALKSILDIPLLLLASFLVNINYSYLFALTVIIVLIPILFCRLKQKTNVNLHLNFI